jgi:colicin import membrane protein
MSEDKVTIAPNTDNYQPGRTASGAKSLHNGDSVAATLNGATLDETYKLAGVALNETVKELKGKYGHLNDGMQRMNLGNRLRGAVAKLEKEKEGSGEKFLRAEGGFIREAVKARAAATPVKAAKPAKAVPVKAKVARPAKAVPVKAKVA